jgi:hypothetical protein
MKYDNICCSAYQLARMLDRTQKRMRGEASKTTFNGTAQELFTGIPARHIRLPWSVIPQAGDDRAASSARASDNTLQQPGGEGLVFVVNMTFEPVFGITQEGMNILRTVLHGGKRLA